MPEPISRRWTVALLAIVLVFLHNTLPCLTMMPRVNVDEPWLMERAYQVWTTGIPSQPMLGLNRAYLLQVGYGYLLAPWLGVLGFDIFQARLFGVLLGLGIVLLVASIGRRLLDGTTGLAAALFLAVDSNFLGGVRNTRTDIPSVFFATAALAAYAAGRQSSRPAWFALSGASAGIAILCHGNAFWVAAVLLIWFLLDYGRRAFAVPYGYWFVGGLLSTFGPYLAVVALRWPDMQAQIANFASDRVPGWHLAFLWRQMRAEVDRYRYWYFGLVTNAVPNPLLRVFQLATVAGVPALVVRAVGPGRAEGADPTGPSRVLVLALGAAFVFAALINNKVPVYFPHLLIGFSLTAGFAVSSAARRVTSRIAPAAAAIALIAYGAAGVAYYEKWYASARKSELVPYETTESTLRTLVPSGPKYVFAAPQFWTPFHDAVGTTFYTYSSATSPVEHGLTTSIAGVGDDRPIYLVVDEAEWLPELTARASQPPTGWQRAWIRFVRERCATEAIAPGTAYGTMALYHCVLAGAPPQVERPRIVAGIGEFVIGEVVWRQSARDLAAWDRYQDQRRTPASAAREVALTHDGVRIAGGGWPGLVRTFDGEVGAAYLVRAVTARTRDGDLLYLGTWRQPQVRTLAGSSSAGIIAPFIREPWFPGDRVFVAAMPRVDITIYSEAQQTDFVIESLDVYRLRPRVAADTRTIGR